MEVQEAQREARRAEKEFKAAPTGYSKEKLNQGLQALAATINKEKTKAWRATLQRATHHEKAKALAGRFFPCPEADLSNI